MKHLKPAGHIRSNTYQWLLIKTDYNLDLEEKLDKFHTVLTRNMFSKHKLKVKVNNKRQAPPQKSHLLGKKKLNCT